jgi:hypothetical protein
MVAPHGREIFIITGQLSVGRHCSAIYSVVSPTAATFEYHTTTSNVVIDIDCHSDWMVEGRLIQSLFVFELRGDVWYDSVALLANDRDEICQVFDHP